MKKINILFIASLLTLFYACDMDKKPHGQLEASEAIRTLRDCRNYRNGIYATLRGLTTGNFVVYGDIQTDSYHAVTGNGGAMSALYSGNIQAGMGEFETIWAGNLTTIGSANFIINRMDVMFESDEFTSKERYELQHYLGEALFTRAFCYFDMAQKFCAAYSPEAASKPHSGLPLRTIYNPTNNSDEYPGRSTLEDTYKLILSDLETALDHLLEFEAQDKAEEALPKVMSPYITSDVVKAMQARVALAMKNYTLAIKKAEEVINTRRYALIGTEQNLYSFWRNDVGSEALWRVSMTAQHLGFPTGEYFFSNTGNPAFVPTANTIEMYDKSKDIRFDSYFTNRTVSLAEGSANISAFNKYPGNPTLFTSGNNQRNMSKPFRIAEQYLIVAESAAALGQNSKANQYLNELKSRRISGYSPQQHTGENLTTMIRQERHKELIGEGFRLSDLKRWGVGFKRSPGQNDIIINKVGDVHLLEYEAGDHRFVWPIPKAEMEANPQLQGHQNPGY